MSQQLYFCLSEQELAEQEAKVRDELGLILLNDLSPTEKPVQCKSLVDHTDGQLMRSYHLVMPENLDCVVMRYIPNRNIWTVDALKSPTIAVTTPLISGKLLRKGRFIYIDKYYSEDGSLVKKSNDVKVWVGKIYKGFKKTLTKRGAIYFGNDAISILDSGGELDWQ